MNSVCFTGHRPPKINSENETFVRNALTECVASLTGRGFTHFISGMALGVDMIAAEVVLEAKNSNPAITLECAIPCRSQASRWSAADRKKYADILGRADKTTYVSEHYSPFCMQLRNAYMVDNSDVVVAVFDGSSGGTANTVNYAGRRNREIIFISPEVKSDV